MPDANWWEAYPPEQIPMHQPFAKVVPAQTGIIAEAQTCVALAGVEPRPDYRGLLTQMTELSNHVSGFRFQTALRRLRENP